MDMTSSIHISVSLSSLQKKCFGERLTADTLFVADLHANGLIAVVVADEEGTIFTDRDKDTIQTAFTTKVYGSHTTCVENLSKSDISVWLDLKWGPEARDYSQIAKKEHLDEVVVQLRHITDELQQYHDNLLYMRARELKMRAKSDSTASRVSTFCVITIITVIITGAVQGFYFRNFFRAKKII